MNEHPIFTYNEDAAYIERTDNPEYPVFATIFKTMQGRFWLPETINMQDDYYNFQMLPVSLQRAFTENLSWQILADTNQTSNLLPLIRHCSNVEVRRCLIMQMMEESNHSGSYQYITNSMYSDPTTMLDSIKDMKEVNIRASYTKLNPASTSEAVCQMLAMEALSFTTSFLTTLAIDDESGSKLSAAALQIKKIAADEAGHVVIYSHLAKIMKVPKEMLTLALVIAIEHEVRWAEYITSVHPIPHIHPTSVRELLEAKANSILRAIYPNVERVPVPSLLNWYNLNIDTNTTKTEQQAKDSGAYSLDVLVNDWV